MPLLNPTDLAAINADHRMLFNIMLEARDTVLPCIDRQSCQHSGCLHMEFCDQLVREIFHRVLFSTIGHFGRQERLIRPHIPDSSFQRHAESHADISEAINEAIAAFSKTGNAFAAFADIRAIERLYETHYLTLDAEVNAQIIQPQAAASPAPKLLPRNRARLPDLPLTGNEEMDHEHRQLHAMLERTRSVCQTLESGCDQCSHDLQGACNTAAIDLLTDALMLMVEHFRKEDKLLAKTPAGKARDAHLHEHAEISRQLSQIVADYEDSNTALCIHRLSETLHDWVKNHIVEHDIPLMAQHTLTIQRDKVIAAA